MPNTAAPAPPGPTDRLQQLRAALDAQLIDAATFAIAAAAIEARPAGQNAVLAAHPAHIAAHSTVAAGAGAMAVAAGGLGVGGDVQGPINYGVWIEAGAQPGASAATLQRAYLARLLLQSDALPLLMGEAANAQVPLSAVYTALLTQRGDGDALAAAQRKPPRHDGDAAPRQSALEAANDHPRLVLLGGPGSGKSSFAAFVALAMAGELLGHPDINLAALTAPVPGADDEPRQLNKPPKPQRWQHGALLPVSVVLRDLATALPAPGQQPHATQVWDHIVRRLAQANLADYAPVLRAHLLQHGGLILLDGLDEVPDANERRVQIKQALQDFIATYSRCRYLVTSRTYAYQHQHWQLPGFEQAHLLPFTQGQINAFIGAWYGQMVQRLRLTQADADDRAALLQREVAAKPRLRELAERPLLLTLMAQLQTKAGGQLPQRREALYDKCVDMLLDQWEGMKVVVDAAGQKQIEPSLAEWLKAERGDIRKQLNRLAFEAHRDQPLADADTDADTGADAARSESASIPEPALIAALLRASTDTGIQVRQLQAYLRDRAGILAFAGEGLLRFPHRSFQEYLAACHLTDDDFPETLAGLAVAEPQRWREVTLLAAAKAARGAANNAWDLAEALSPQAVPPPAAAPSNGVPTATHASGEQHARWGALLAGQVVTECADLAAVPQRHQAKLQRWRDAQSALLCEHGALALPALERALAGRSLAAMGDVRPEVMCLQAMQFCGVPAGPFVMGSNGPFDDEKPQHRVDLRQPYFIGRHPVTVAQWREFVQQSQHRPSDEHSLQGLANHPVTDVNWHDAMAFCAHLTRLWRCALPAGWEVTLPTEAQWEKAARGGEQVPNQPLITEVARLSEGLKDIAKLRLQPNASPARTYPWADPWHSECANAEQRIGQTTAVGCYSAGASPLGCEDMAGNVWEWTCSLWGSDFSKPAFKYPVKPDDSRRDDVTAGDEVLRLVRGGSWDGSSDDARCAYRDRSHPDDRDLSLGFRVVLRSSPV